jgi:hypothetical protein
MERYVAITTAAAPGFGQAEVAGVRKTIPPRGTKETGSVRLTSALLVSVPTSWSHFDSPSIAAISEKTDEYGDGSYPFVPSASSESLVADRDLSPRDRRYYSEFLLPRTGSDGQLWWPVDELPPYE